MCGIAGFFTVNKKIGAEDMVVTADRMAATLRHRGPDFGDVWVCMDVPLVLAHRRLSIIDLSENGNQPMHSRNGRYVISFNGEIYNHRELRQKLESCGHSFRGHSDTEVILAGCEEWTVEQTIKNCVGMFAIALWDTNEKELFLIRDRMGEKPLYYGWQRNSFLFSSELKAITVHPDFQNDINRDALSLFVRHRYIPAPYSAYRGIQKLEPGMILKIPVGKACTDSICVKGHKLRYWSLKEIAEKADSKGYIGTAEDAVSELDALLTTSLKGQMISDVPLGAFLSGGIDSSTVVAQMQNLSSRPVNTFCIGFEDDHFNEAIYANRIAKHLGCNHTELYVTPRQAREVIPMLPRLYDEPFADASQIPTFLVAQLAKRNVTVALSGDGGDELFYGYGIYTSLFKRWRIARRLNIRSKTIQNVALSVIKRICNANRRQLEVARSLLAPETHIDVYRSMISAIDDPCKLVLNSREPATVFSNRELWPRISNKESSLMVLDALSYLPDDILVKVDRAAMGCSLETRIPLLDHRIVQFASALPFEIKFHKNVTKWPLRQILYKYVPCNYIERPKKGFGLPLGKWLRKELRDWAYDLLQEKKLREDGILNVQSVQDYMSEHMQGECDHTELLWSILMLQCWLHQKDVVFI